MTVALLDLSFHYIQNEKYASWLIRPLREKDIAYKLRYDSDADVLPFFSRKESSRLQIRAAVT